MSLITPEFGLLFWMVLIFGIVFFLLWKFGFPIITRMVEDRNRTIEKSLRDAQEIEARMRKWKDDEARMMDETRREQARLLREATETRNNILSEAKAEARAEAEKILSEAKVQIAAEKESALRDARKEIALLSVQVAEKVLRRELSDDGERRIFIDTLVDEASQTDLLS